MAEEHLSELKNKNPIDLLKTWLKEAKDHPEIKQAEAMVLSSYGMASLFSLVGRNHWSWANSLRLSSRVVLLKEVTSDSLIFYTNYKSLKGTQLHLGLSYVALNIYWPALNKQIRIEGKIRKTSRTKSLEYWSTRPFESQISQFISQQSKPLESRGLLEQKWQSAQKKFYGKPVPCPQHWGGFAVQPLLIEFWKENPHRLHDRLLFFKKSKFIFWTQKNQWTSTLLYP